MKYRYVGSIEISENVNFENTKKRLSIALETANYAVMLPNGNRTMLILDKMED